MEDLIISAVIYFTLVIIIVFYFLIEKLTNMDKSLDELLVSVEENATVGDSVVTLLSGIKQQLDEALSGTKLSPAVQAKVNAIFEASEADKAKLQEAILANTPPVEPPVE